MNAMTDGMAFSRRAMLRGGAMLGAGAALAGWPLRAALAQGGAADWPRVDAFMRELVSNGCDAIKKYRWLVSNGQAPVDEAPDRIDVVVNKEEGTLTFTITKDGKIHRRQGDISLL